MRQILLLVLVLACAPALAQSMYRCGNQFQDRPCDNSVTPAHANSTPESGESQAMRQRAPVEKTMAHQQYECARYDRELEGVYAAQSRGGNHMDNLNTRAREIQARRAAAGCS